MSHDIIAIEQLLAAYCHKVDRGSAAEVAALFAVDAVLKPHYDGPYELVGRAEVERWYAHYNDNFRSHVRHLKHMLMSPSIELEGDRARGVSYLLATAVSKDGASGFYTTGTYHDTYVRAADRWLFQERRIEVEWMAPHERVQEKFPPLDFPH